MPETDDMKTLTKLTGGDNGIFVMMRTTYFWDFHYGEARQMLFSCRTAVLHSQKRAPRQSEIHLWFGNVKWNKCTINAQSAIVGVMEGGSGPATTVDHRGALKHCMEEPDIQAVRPAV